MVVTERRNSVVGGAQHGGQCDSRAPKRIMVTQLSANANEAKVFKARAAPLGLRDNLVNALKLLVTQQKKTVTG